MSSANDLQAKRHQLSSLAVQWREWPFDLPEGLTDLGSVNEVLAVAVVAGRAIGCPKQAAAWVSNMSPWLQAWVGVELQPSVADFIDLLEYRRAGVLVRATVGSRLRHD